MPALQEILGYFLNWKSLKSDSWVTPITSEFGKLYVYFNYVSLDMTLV
jgi:hypothetical protein